MEWVLIDWRLLVAALMVLAAMALAYSALGTRKTTVRRRPSVLAADKLAFYQALQRAVPDDCVIVIRARVSELLMLPEKKNVHKSKEAVLAGKVDFAICRRESLEPLAAILLHDEKQQRAKRASSNETLDELFQAAGLILIRVPLQAPYDTGQLQRLLAPVTNAA